MNTKPSLLSSWSESIGSIRHTAATKWQVYSLAFLISLALAACGDNVENVYQTGMEVYASEDDLPKCTDDNEGDQAFVKGESSARICVDGDWISMNGSDAEFSCKMVELKDKSGSKIVCNGDSIGVVLNGEKGEDGKNGEDGVSGTGCSITDCNDTAVVLVCGDSTITIALGQSEELEEGDLDREPISLDSLAGYTQKGPFLKGSTVYLYELSDGRTLKQTNGNFTSNISSDDGRYKFSARDLVSQYAMVVVDGYYRNEVTGATSDATIRLKALTDMRKRSSVNVNLLTHMEFDRVYNLVTKEMKTVKKAKQQAQEEILKLFHIELDGKTDAEDMDVFGKSDADAALLAISVILQGDRSEAELASLLAALASDLADNGLWDNLRDRAQIADWAMKKTFSTEGLAAIRANVEGWGLGDGKAPAFEGMVTHFWETELKVGECSKANAGAIRAIGNKYSTYYAKKDSVASEGDSSDVRLICDVSGEAPAWRYATDIEKNTASFTEVSDDLVKYGAVNTKNVYVYEDGWRRGADLDMTLNLSCIASRAGKIVKSVTTWYTCDTVPTAWREATNAEADTAGFGIPTGNDPIVRMGNINDYIYVYEDGWRYGTNLDNDTTLGPCLKDRVGVIRQIGTGDQGYYRCSDDVPGTVSGKQILYKWRQASSAEADTASLSEKPDLESGMIYKGNLKAPKDNYYKYDGSSWKVATAYEMDTHDTITHLPWVSEDDGTFRAGIVNANLYYVYDAYMGKWREEKSELEHDPDLGGCTARRTTEMHGSTRGRISYSESKKRHYYCKDTMWVVASQARWDNYDSWCKTDPSWRGVYYGEYNKDSVYVCEADTFRTLTVDERWARNNAISFARDRNVRCSAIDQDEKINVETAFYYCRDGHYVWNGFATVVGSTSVDPNDETEIHIVGIANQMWTQKNMPVVGEIGQLGEGANPYSGALFTFEEAQSICDTLHVETYDFHRNLSFRLPSKEDWDMLLENIGRNEGKSMYELDYQDLNKLAPYLKSNHFWEEKSGGSDDYYFSAVPTVTCGDQICYDYDGLRARWWVSDGGTVEMSNGTAIRYLDSSYSGSMAAVRCIANESFDAPPPYNRDPIETIVFPRE